MAQNLNDAAVYAALAKLIYRRDEAGSQDTELHDAPGLMN